MSISLMRVVRVSFLLIVLIASSGCAASWSKQRPSPPWTTGFWLWQGDYNPGEDHDREIDVLFAQVGTIDRDNFRQSVGVPNGKAYEWRVYGTLPNGLPKTKDYWLVFRCGRQAVPDLQTASMLAESVSSILGEARQRHINVVGVQLDVDSPTRALPQYARYLREVRKELPHGLALSITALLDWFRTGTDISEVIREVDEFVPQFYDIDAQTYDDGAAIAAKIDAARWGPVFNQFGKRFRVGISTFGRSRLVPGTIASRSHGLTMYRDVVPLDIATNPAFRLEASRNAANELVLSYRTTKRVRIGYTEFSSGDAIQFVLATPESVRTAVGSARQMKGNIAGVVFFRWPSSGEALTMQPEEVLVAAGLPRMGWRTQGRIDVVDGRCAAVACVDLYLQGPAAFSPKPLQYHVHSSVEFEYFLPEKNIPVSMANPSELQVSLPPYCARGRLYLGRVITARPSQFEVEEEP